MSTEILTGNADFNWESYEKGENISGLSQEQLEQAYDGTLNKVSNREVVNGTVISINKREVIVNIGYKSDGIIPVSEFRYNPELAVGDEVEVLVEKVSIEESKITFSLLNNKKTNKIVLHKNSKSKKGGKKNGRRN